MIYTHVLNRAGGPGVRSPADALWLGNFSLLADVMFYGLETLLVVRDAELGKRAKSVHREAGSVKLMKTCDLGAETPRQSTPLAMFEPGAQMSEDRENVTSHR